jgi:TrmH family RNA methyltransferase
MPLISSRSNTKVKQARMLRRRKIRQETNLFLVEGIRHVGEAINADADIDSIFFAPDMLTSEFAASLIEKASHKGIPVYATTADVFKTMAEKENPQGILAVVHKPQIRLFELNPDIFSWAVAIISPQDPGNIGSILRSIDAVGASGLVLLDKSVDPYHPNSIRASMGTIFWHPVVCASFEHFAQWVHNHNYHVYATTAHTEVDYREIKMYKFPRILLMGGERQGLNPEQLQVGQNQIRLPMKGHASSLNLSVAAGVMLYKMQETDESKEI